MVFQPNSKKGFSLIAVAAILAVIAILVVTLLPNDADKYSNNIKTTSNVKLKAIHDALVIYYNTNTNAMPFPASPTAIMSATTAPLFGIQDTGCSTANGLAHAIDAGVTNNNVCIGAVPTRDLGLPDNYEFDEWGNRFIYAVDTTGHDSLNVTDTNGTKITVTGSLSGTGSGSGGCGSGGGGSGGSGGTGLVRAVVFSSGADGLGAIGISGKTIAASVTACTGNYDTTKSELQNCNGDSSFVQSGFSSSSAFYDDLMIYIAFPSTSSCPADVPGCTIWLDAQDVNGDGSTTTGEPNTGAGIPTWVDKSCHNNNATQISSGAQPTYQPSGFNSKPSVHFNASNHNVMNLPDMTTPPLNWTSFAVVSRASPYGSNYMIALINSISANLYSLFQYTNQRLYVANPNSNTNYGDSTVGPSLWTTQSGASALNIWKSGSLVQSGGSAGTSGSNFNLLGARLNGGEYSTGDMAEIIFYPTVLSDDQRNTVECYLESKWGIVGNCSPIVWYKFDEAAGTGSIVDSTPFPLPIPGHDSSSPPSLQRTPQPTQGVAGKYNNAISFNGNQQFIQTNYLFYGHDSYGTTGTITWWMKPGTSYTTNQGFWGGGDSGSVRLRCAIISSSWLCGWGDGSYGTTNMVKPAASATNFPTGVWTFYAFSWGPNGSSLYQNGALLSSNTNPAGTGRMSSAFYIGEEIQNGTFYQGAMDDFRIYNIPLTAAQITKLYNTGSF